LRSIYIEISSLGNN